MRDLAISLQLSRTVLAQLNARSKSRGFKSFRHQAKLRIYELINELLAAEVSA